MDEPAERITAADAARQFSNILDRVQEQGARFEITRDDEVIARIEPVEKPPIEKARTLGELIEHIRKGPRLDPENSLAFEEDLANIRREAKLPDIEWD